MIVSWLKSVKARIFPGCQTCDDPKGIDEETRLSLQDIQRRLDRMIALERGRNVVEHEIWPKRENQA